MFGIQGFHSGVHQLTSLNHLQSGIFDILFQLHHPVSSKNGSQRHCWRQGVQHCWVHHERLIIVQQVSYGLRQIGKRHKVGIGPKRIGRKLLQIFNTPTVLLTIVKGYSLAQTSPL